MALIWTSQLLIAFLFYAAISKYSGASEKGMKKATFWKIVSHVVNINLLHLYFRLYLGKFSRTFGEIEFIFKVAFGGYKKWLGQVSDRIR